MINRFSTVRFQLIAMLLIASLALLSVSCSRKSGCPAEDAHTQVDKHGRYKTGKTTSGLGLVPAKGKKKSKSR